MEKTTEKYTATLKASEYDYLEVEMDMVGFITMKFLDERWRTQEDSIALLKEMIGLIATLPSKPSK